MQDHSPLKIEYLRTEIMVNMQNKKTFTAKMTTEIQYSQRPLYGRLCNRMLTIPVPMLTLNQDGVKLRT